MTRKELAAMLLTNRLQPEAIVKLGIALIAHGCSQRGDTCQESVDAWRELRDHMDWDGVITDAIRNNWDKFRS